MLEREAEDTENDFEGEERMMINFTIPGVAQAKQRARTLKNGHSYTPAETVSYENWVKLCFNENRPPGWQPYEGAVNMQIAAYLPIPKSESKKNREKMLTGEIRPIKKRPGDWDNLGKSISDALNQIAYRDDSQIVECRVSKIYGETPEVRVSLEFR